MTYSSVILTIHHLDLVTPPLSSKRSEEVHWFGATYLGCFLYTINKDMVNRIDCFTAYGLNRGSWGVMPLETLPKVTVGWLPENILDSKSLGRQFLDFEVSFLRLEHTIRRTLRVCLSTTLISVRMPMGTNLMFMPFVNY